MPEDVGTAQQPLRQQAHRASVCLYKASDIVAESAVPLLPAVADEGPHLIEAGGVPRLSDQFGAGKDGV